MLLDKAGERYPNYKRNCDIISYVLFSPIVVLFAALAGPLAFQNILNYTITNPKTISSSDATNYTLTAFLAIGIVSLFNFQSNR